jgi:sec-independent protein translocase protein TatB
MFGIGTTEIVVILVVALLVLGPKKLPEIAKSLGKTLGEFRRVTTDVKRTIEMEADQEEDVRARKRIKQEMAGKASKEDQPSDDKMSFSSQDRESPQPEAEKSSRPEDRQNASSRLDEKDPYPEAKEVEESQDIEPEAKPEPEAEPEKKDGATQ